MSRRSYSCDWNKKGAVEIGAFLFYYDLAKKRAFSSVVERSVHIGEVAGPIPATPTKRKSGVGFFTQPHLYHCPIEKADPSA